MTHHGWIGVDLDGTLAEYTEFVSYDHIGPPISAMVERVRRWLTEGKDVRIFTARVAKDVRAIPYINVWCEQHLGKALPVTCTKDYEMIELWDDRCVQVIRNTGECMEEYAYYQGLQDGIEISKKQQYVNTD